MRANVVGRSAVPSLVRWTSTDSMLYALSVGAGRGQLAPYELRFVTENSHAVVQECLPTFATIITKATALVNDVFPRAEYRRVQASQDLEVHMQVPPSGSVLVHSSIISFQDKGSGGLVVTESIAKDGTSGVPVFTARTGAFIRGVGGFGGPRVKADAPLFPDKPADHQQVHSIRPEQALVFRLNGDRNPLHSDPSVALKAGFSGPILHGLCTYGFVGRSVLAALCDGDAGRFREFSFRFLAPVFPGDELGVEIWALGNGSGVLRASTGRGTVVGEGICKCD